MSRTSDFKFTNRSASGNTVGTTALALTGNYSLMQDQSDIVKLNNKTAPIDAEEIISFRSRDAAVLRTDLNIQFPSKVQKYVEYSVRVDDVLSTTDSSDASFRVDEPIVCSIAFRHAKSGNIGNAQVLEVLNRAISALQKADGTWRMDDLMRSAERPVVD